MIYSYIDATGPWRDRWLNNGFGFNQCQILIWIISAISDISQIMWNGNFSNKFSFFRFEQVLLKCIPDIADLAALRKVCHSATEYAKPEHVICKVSLTINTLRPKRNRRHYAGDIFKCIFFNQNVKNTIKISLKFVLKGPINNISVLFQIMVSRRPDDKPSSEPMVVRWLRHIRGLNELITLIGLYCLYAVLHIGWWMLWNIVTLQEFVIMVTVAKMAIVRWKHNKTLWITYVWSKPEEYLWIYYNPEKTNCKKTVGTFHGTFCIFVVLCTLSLAGFCRHALSHGLRTPIAAFPATA